MKELLFENKIEKEALENLLALNQIKKYDKEIEKYSEEIQEEKNKMIEILKDQDIDETYVDKMHKYTNILTNMDGENNRIQELNSIIDENENRINEFQSKISDVENEIQELKKEIFETNEPNRVIECQNEIENNNARINDLNEILNNLISDNTPLLIEREYLIAKNNDLDFNIPNYNKNDISTDLETITIEFNDKVSKLDLSVREEIEFCQKKIKNRENEISKYVDKKNEVLNTYPNAETLDITKAYEDLSTLLTELGLTNKTTYDDKNIFDETESNEKEEIQVDIKKDIKDEITSLEEEQNVVEETKEVINEETKEEENNDEIESVSYVLSDGESLELIADKVYPSKDNWEAIYYFNKETIDSYLVSNGFATDFDNIKNLASDTTVFTGIKLEIPTDYNYKI